MHTDQELQSNLASVYWDARCVILRKNCPNRGSCDENQTHLKRAFGSFIGVHDQSTTLITKPGTPRAEVYVDGESSPTLFSRA